MMLSPPVKSLQTIAELEEPACGKSDWIETSERFKSHSKRTRHALLHTQRLTDLEANGPIAANVESIKQAHSFLAIDKPPKKGRFPQGIIPVACL
jgi:hypothetical protein